MKHYYYSINQTLALGLLDIFLIGNEWFLKINFDIFPKFMTNFASAVPSQKKHTFLVKCIRF